MAKDIEERRGPGRPSKFTEQTCEQVRKLAQLGATDMEICDFLGICYKTFTRWKEAKPEFVEALKTGKVAPDDRVERSLYARALGYEHDETDIRVVAGEIVQTTVRKHYPPDTVACIFWLKNRRPGEWRQQPLESGADAIPESVKVDVVDASLPDDGESA